MKIFLSGRLLVIAVCFIYYYGYAQTTEPAPVGPIPSQNQLRWQELEYYGFIHFSLNTYTNQSWGYGNEDVKLFNPTALDCRQWVRTCKEAGMKGVILVAKHHCGFCLWPSKYTEYSVKNAPWKNGHGDVVREMADACREYGLKLGLYLSPWDRNRADYGKPEYITYFRNQLTELLTNYGPIFEIWFDGANGGSGYYGGANETRTIDRKTYYDWQNTYALVRKLQPGIVIWNDNGDRADLRWVGTEAGNVGETNWSLLNATGDVPYDMLHFGVENGNAWVPAEVNTSIRPEWFYHPAEDHKVKTVPQLMDIYYNSIGHNATLLLNFPVMPNGLINSKDIAAAKGFAKAVKNAFTKNLSSNKTATASNVRGGDKRFAASNAIDENPSTYWATDDSVTAASLAIDLGHTTRFNRFVAGEYIRLGQRVKAFAVDALEDGRWKELSAGTTIGYKRILRFPAVTASKVRLRITAAKGCLLISGIGVYYAPQILTAPVITRNQAGEVAITPADNESMIYYSINGTTPGPASIKYNGPFLAGGKPYIRAVAYDPSTRQASPVAEEHFDISRKEWRIESTDDAKASAVLDGNPATAWHQRMKENASADIVVDLGRPEKLTGFRYLPDQSPWNPGIIAAYELYVSTDGQQWKLVSKGEFANIKNNPLWQTVTFTPVNTRYIRFRAIKNTDNTNEVGYAGIDVLTSDDGDH
ncbi:MAG TPA: alpha-L-fucosidase [Chitinophagaceae bacterium]|nr:alpha-L-fucosidase [Chitinophagaceae bacterium]